MNCWRLDSDLEQRQTALLKNFSMNNSSPISAEMIKGLLASFSAIFGDISHEKRKQLVHALIKEEITITEDWKLTELSYSSILIKK